MKARMSMTSFQKMVGEILNGTPKLGYINPTLNLSVKDFKGWQENYGFGVHPTGSMEIRYEGQALPEGVKLLRRYGFV